MKFCDFVSLLALLSSCDSDSTVFQGGSFLITYLIRRVAGGETMCEGRKHTGSCYLQLNQLKKKRNLPGVGCMPGRPSHAPKKAVT